MTSRHFHDVDLNEEDEETPNMALKKAASRVIKLLSLANRSDSAVAGGGLSAGVNKVFPVVAGGDAVMAEESAAGKRWSLLRRLSSKKRGEVAPAPSPSPGKPRPEGFQSCVPVASQEEGPSRGLLSRKGSSCSDIPTIASGRRGSANHDNEGESDVPQGSPRGSSCSNIPLERRASNASCNSDKDDQSAASNLAVTYVKRNEEVQRKKRMSPPTTDTDTPRDREDSPLTFSPVATPDALVPSSSKIVLEPLATRNVSPVADSPGESVNATSTRRRRVVRRGSSLKKQASAIIRLDGTTTMLDPIASTDNEEKTGDEVSVLRLKPKLSEAKKDGVSFADREPDTDEGAAEQGETEFLRTRRRSTLVLEGDLSTLKSRLKTNAYLTNDIYQIC
jgi:hypothetical protein